MERPTSPTAWSEFEAETHEADFESWLRKAARAPDAGDSRQLAFDSAGPRQIAAGAVVANRFTVEKHVATGGMGEIYRAVDGSTSETVAIKVMSSSKGGDARRFEQEASVLAGLSHSAIVRYITHGQTDRSTPYLVMEWLDGEDLSARLKRSPLSVDDTLLALKRACEGLSAAHACGIVHRDLKPSNLFLVGREPSRLKVLDFGLARDTDGTRTLTQSGAVLGTVGYMSPEQAMLPRDADARTDVFALGCILFECLTGRAAFGGANVVAVLAKVLRAEPPRLRELCPQLDEALERLVARCLAKNPGERPSDALALLRELDALEDSRGPAALPVGVTAMEQRIVSVVLGQPTDQSPLGSVEAEAVVTSLGAEPVALRGGGLLVVFTGGGPATDARLAARCALQLTRERPDLVLAVATGRAETTGRIPVGAAIDRATALLSRAEGASGTIAIDELTADLLSSSFAPQRNGKGLVLRVERADLDADSPRSLLGQHTRFVGREKEMSLLELTLVECVGESVARAVLITGPPGQGKSRLADEFVRRVNARGDVLILKADADPVGAGSAFMLVRQLLSRAIGLRDGEPQIEREPKLRAHIARVCPTSDSERTAEFLAELIGGARTGCPSPELRAARNDPQIMNRWLSRSINQWLAGECALQPVLVVVEDLHWGDLPSLACLGEALRSRAARAIMVLGLARPEVSDQFPALWGSAETQHIALARLTPRAAERLVRDALGANVAESAVARIVRRADGNALYLEELARRAVDGDVESVPETVLALVESRLQRLDSEARRVIRAASIFGDVFWDGGLSSVLGLELGGPPLRTRLQALVDAEVIEPCDDSRFAGEQQYEFRHDLLREAAYAMLTDVDRKRGHSLVADWLGQSGEPDPLRLAEHFARSEHPTRATLHYEVAAHAALDGRSVSHAIALVQRGIACGATGAERGRLLLVHAQAAGMSGEWPRSLELAREAVRALPRGSVHWFRGLASLLWSSAFVSSESVTTAELCEVYAFDVFEETGPYGLATFFATEGLTRVGKVDTAREIVRRALAKTNQAAEADPVFGMWLRCARARLQLLDGELGPALNDLLEARAVAERTGAGLGQAMSGFYSVSALSETGHVERAHEAAEWMVTMCEPLGMRAAIDWAWFCVAWTRILADRPTEAIEPLSSLIDRADANLVGAVRAALAQAWLASGDPRQAQRTLQEFPPGQTTGSAEALIYRSRALLELHSDRPDKALACAEHGLSTAAQGSYLSTVSILQLVRAEALLALGDSDAARTAIRAGRDRIFQIASTIQLPELRESYLSGVVAHRRTLALAEQWTERC